MNYINIFSPGRSKYGLIIQGDAAKRPRQRLFDKPMGQNAKNYRCNQGAEANQKSTVRGTMHLRVTHCGFIKQCEHQIMC